MIRRCLFDGFTFAYIASFAVIACLRPDGDALAREIKLCLALFAALMVVGALISAVLGAAGRFQGIRTLGELIYAPLERRTLTRAHLPLHKTFWGWQLLISIAVTVILGFVLTDIDLRRLVELESLTHAMRLFTELASPDWGILPRAIVKMIESVFIAFMATAIAVPISFVLSFFTARNVMERSHSGLFVYASLRAVLNLTRSVEPVLWAILFSIWVSFGPFAGMLALMVHSVASLAKQYSEIIEGVEDGPIEGIESTGANRLQTIWFAIVPQIILPFTSYTIFRWDINVRMATILGFVGGGGIGTMLMEYQGQARWPQVGTIILVIALVVWVMDAFSSHVRTALK